MRDGAAKVRIEFDGRGALYAVARFELAIHRLFAAMTPFGVYDLDDPDMVQRAAKRKLMHEIGGSLGGHWVDVYESEGVTG